MNVSDKHIAKDCLNEMKRKNNFNLYALMLPKLPPAKSQMQLDFPFGEQISIGYTQWQVNSHVLKNYVESLYSVLVSFMVALLQSSAGV